MKGLPIDSLVITCEHGGNRIPAACRRLFRNQRALLESHRGYDAGALVMARALARAFAAPLVTSTTSRLVVDLNRSIGHPQHFSATTRALPSSLRTKLVARYYRPYRIEVERLVRQSVAQGRKVIHISSHSFTPELDGNVRNADVGLLYDPARQRESDLCARWKASLAVLAPQIRVRRNYPYAGKGDGLTSALRRSFPVRAYVGIELEVNQKIVFEGGRRWTALRSALVESLQMCISPTFDANRKRRVANTGDSQ